MEDNIEVVPSEDNGNVPAEAPSEQPIAETPATPAEPTEPVQPAEPELFELPDGRKVEASAVVEEYKNLLSDYTKKSQELAKVGKETLPSNQPANPLEDPEWAPKTYGELVEIAKQSLKEDLAKDEQAKIDARTALEDAVATQLTEVKTLDPNVNENALFIHATKYGFRDLKLAHQNMKDMSEMAKKVQTTTAANIAKRNDPVSVSPGATGQRPDPSQFQNAREYLRSLK